MNDTLNDWIALMRSNTIEAVARVVGEMYAGPDSLYGADHNRGEGFTVGDIRDACEAIIDAPLYNGGDSFDRERVRDLLCYLAGCCLPEYPNALPASLAAYEEGSSTFRRYFYPEQYGGIVFRY